MDWLENTDRIQIDLTSYCNAHCGSCQRHKGPEDDRLHPSLSLDHMSYDTWKKILTDANNLGSIQSVMLNGNWGDAFMHPEIYDFIKFYTELPNLKNFIASTNGSMRTEKFWSDVGKLNAEQDIYIVFCLDGLEDTHEIYRRKTSFDRIIRNMKAYIDAGGRAGVTTTAFDHNIDQLQDIKQLAKDLGAWTWQCRKSHSSKSYESYGITVTQDRVTKDVKESVRFFDESNNRFHPLRDLDNRTNCPWFNERDVQIDPWGQVWSCCYASETRFGIDREYTIHPEYEKYYHKDLDLTKNSLKHALSSDFWKRIKTFDHYICWDNCGVETDKDWENYELLWRDDHPSKLKEKQHG